MIRPYVLPLLALSLLSGCTVLDVMSGKEPVTRRTAYTLAGRNNDGDTSVGVAASYQLKDESLVSDFLVERVDVHDSNDFSTGVSGGLRYMLSDEALQPYVGLGVSTSYADGDWADLGIYGRLGAEWKLGRWRLGADWRPYEENGSYDNQFLTVYLGYDF